MIIGMNIFDGSVIGMMEALKNFAQNIKIGKKITRSQIPFKAIRLDGRIKLDL